ncbi:MAG: YncE family protein [Planctomycetota bacterium]
MRSSTAFHRFCFNGACLVLLLTLLVVSGCSGGSSGGKSSSSAGDYNTRYSNLYQEVGFIQVQGNWISDTPKDANDVEIADAAPREELRCFYPRTPLTSELYDSDSDGLDDTYINGLSSIANAANRLLNIDLAACVVATEKDPWGTTYGFKNKHLGYLNSLAWTTEWAQVSGTNQYTHQFPDTMPASAGAGGTNETQFIQIILPFTIDPDCLFETDTVAQDLDFLNPYYLTVTNENWGDNTALIDFKSAVPAVTADLVTGISTYHVPCMVFVDGLNSAGEAPSAELAALSQGNIKFTPDAGTSTIVIVAQASAGLLTQPSAADTAFALWGANEEMRIHLRRVKSSTGQEINVDSKWAILKTGSTAIPPIAVVSIDAVDKVNALYNGSIIYDWDDPAQTDPADPRTIEIVERETSFLIHFNKPVIPETVGQSIVFNAAPFNGNTGPVPTDLVLHPPASNANPCANNGAYRESVAPNVAIISTIYHSDGSSSHIQGIVPFRCHPLHQNNLCTYVLNPILPLPGSTDLGSPPFYDNSVTSITRMRVKVKVFLHDENNINGKPTEMAANPNWPDPEPTHWPDKPWVPYPPANTGITGYFGKDGEIQTTEFEKDYTVTSGGRYVNAPVSPHALYYAMGPKGLGVIDLDGNGFTTNDPAFTKDMLVTTQWNYNRWGAAKKGLYNLYSYGSKAVGVTQPYIGLGQSTPMPGVNEGSSGIDTVVKDSNGKAQLFPNPSGTLKNYNITDVEIGDFLDSIYYDKGNEFAHSSLHISAVNSTSTGSGRITFENNLIATPPTPNPPPLTIPIGMRPVHVILDEFNILDEGAFVIMTKEVFTVQINLIVVGNPVRIWTAAHTGFIHLEHYDVANSATDEPFPPNKSTFSSTGAIPDYMNLGPLADSSTIGQAFEFGSRQQIGNFLFVADKSNNTVHVLNSNTMDEITSLSGLSSPDSVAVTPDLKTLYVSNSGGQSVSVYNVNPRTADFLTQISTIWVGSQPKGICCQPDGEDVFVCNYGQDTISIINPKTNSVRKTLSSLLNGPWDMVAGPRQTTFGWGSQVYHAYISNNAGNNVLIYESGPDGFGGVGYDDILDPIPSTGQNGQIFLPIDSPRGLCWDPAAGLQYPLTGGCYVAHSSGSYGVVSRIEYTAQQAPYGPIFLIPNSGAIGGTPGFGKRIFLITAQWGGPNSPLSGQAASDVALLDYNRYAWLNDNWLGNYFNVTNIGDLPGPLTQLPINNKHPLRTLTMGSGSYNQTYNPDQMYVSFQNTPSIDVISTSSSEILKTITGLPTGVKVLKTYFKF